MGDMAEGFRAMTADRQARHAKWKEQNTEVIANSGIPYEVRPESLLFRERGMRKVDFFPSTGRWIAHQTTSKKRQVFRGGAKAFLAWYMPLRTL